MLKVNNITMKNFMSVGAVTQAINLDENALTLILGDNIDLGSEGSRNGVGKSVIVDALSFVLYGTPVRKISVGNLVNKINGKNMLVTLEFEKNDQVYRIERGRNPTVFKFFVNGKDVEKGNKKKDEAQGESRETQPEIERLVGFSPLLFKHIIALNTKTIPFLDESAAKQREIIEELLGITQLSEKAEILKGNIKDTKTEIEREEFRHSMIVDTNKKTQRTIDQLSIKSGGWESTHVETLEKIEIQIVKMSEIDIDAEIELHKEAEKQKEILRKADEVKREAQLALEGRNRATQAAYDEHTREQAALYEELERDALAAARALKEAQSRLKELVAQEKIFTESHANLLDHKCPECGQDIHDDQHDEMVAKSEANIEALITKKNDYLDDIKNGEKSVTKSDGAVKKQHEVLSSIPPVILETKAANIDMVSQESVIIKTQYVDIHEAYEHKSNLNNLVSIYEKEAMSENPFVDQISTIAANIQKIDYALMNELVNLFNHQDFLIKLLTRKDSNIRIQIVEQNLGFLNSRLDHYCKQIGLPHQVYFVGDLSVDILKLGQSYDCGNLSSGESTRLVLALSWAFRDMHEALNSPINLMFIDELIDSGMDAKGAESALAILKQNSRDHKKNIFLISHRDDFIPRVSNVLMVEMKNNFTDYRYEVDVQI